MGKGGKKGKVRPNGFEGKMRNPTNAILKLTQSQEFFADPPITPEEALEERHDLYSPARPFADRIQTCIQRYRARRKLDETKANVLNKYLILGGIETTNKAFTGGALDEETLASATAEEIAAIQATDFVRPGGSKKYYDPAESDKWVVDWEGVAKGFLYVSPSALQFSTDIVQLLQSS
jgi:hypothetical protein